MRKLYEHCVIEDVTIKELNDTYKFSKEHASTKEKVDYDIEIWYLNNINDTKKDDLCNHLLFYCFV